MTETPDPSSHPLSKEYWEKAKLTAWEQDGQEMKDVFDVYDADEFFYSSGLGVGFAQMIDAEGIHATLLAVIDAIIAPCDCGEPDCEYPESTQARFAFGFPIEMGKQIIDMVQSALDYYSANYGEPHELSFDDAD